ncbi:MAG: DUF4440 domain-containing protein [Bacteroidetes Order II. Incertae sedis bacterium]|jgi:ketosteroid isomerase-like protein|nr:DUF4440 domain-containing protein [Bacteroidetes Order II. bacterium]MBT4051606.1 DUF4440 domain-containing protein [Bacteroidetes Order II. bacterium]MBT4602245.1 DUF4440 domain-containing protein [Bacteroidetes Order II. bacterium]MBT5249468.1 DUF4440 domain-containing protein [Bacteroidetes Order II. bacterium]MBT6201509.1 DUF4440 domain-containing protein [Bacteroidetes Order II. bacterium]
MNKRLYLPNSYQGILSYIIIPLFLIAGCGADVEPTESVPEQTTAEEVAAIKDVLMRQQAAWNAGDIDAFMDDYVKSDTLRFTSDGVVRYGWETSLERYYNAYPSRDAMGRLVFDDLDIDVLSPEWALTFGSWHLTRGGDFEDIGGKYTLLMHKSASGWKVLYDHTSTLN